MAGSGDAAHMHRAEIRGGDAELGRIVVDDGAQGAFHVAQVGRIGLQDDRRLGRGFFIGGREIRVLVVLQGDAQGLFGLF